VGTVALMLAVADRVVLNYRWQILLGARGVPVGFVRLFRVSARRQLPGLVSAQLDGRRRRCASPRSAARESQQLW